MAYHTDTQIVVEQVEKEPGLELYAMTVSNDTPFKENYFYAEGWIERCAVTRDGPSNYTATITFLVCPDEPSQKQFMRLDMKARGTFCREVYDSYARTPSRMWAVQGVLVWDGPTKPEAWLIYSIESNGRKNP